MVIWGQGHLGTQGCGLTVSRGCGVMVTAMWGQRGCGATLRGGGARGHRAPLSSTGAIPAPSAGARSPRDPPGGDGGPPGTPPGRPYLAGGVAGPAVLSPAGSPWALWLGGAAAAGRAPPHPPLPRNRGGARGGAAGGGPGVNGVEKEPAGTGSRYRARRGGGRGDPARGHQHRHGGPGGAPGGNGEGMGTGTGAGGPGGGPGGCPGMVLAVSPGPLGSRWGRSGIGTALGVPAGSPEGPGVMSRCPGTVTVTWGPNGDTGGLRGVPWAPEPARGGPGGGTGGSPGHRGVPVATPLRGGGSPEGSRKVTQG